MKAHALTLNSSKILHSHARDSTMAAESKLYLLGNSCTRGGQHFQVNQLSFAHSNSGQNLTRFTELPSLRRAHTKLRAERVTRRPPQEDADSWKQTDRADYGENEAPSMWDSNAENIRRRRSNRMSYARPVVDEEAPSPSMGGRNNWSEDSMWDYETTDRSGTGNGRWGFNRSNRSENSEWDYVSEAPRPTTKQGWKWWFDDNGDDEYEEYEEEYEEEEDNWLSWLNVDVKNAFLILRWGLPAAFLLATAVLPVIGNPLILLFGFCIFPTVVKWLNPVVKDFFRPAGNPFGSSSSGRTKKRSQAASSYSRRSQDTAEYTDFSSPSQPSSQPITRSYDSGAPRQKVTSEKVSLGGWDDLVDDRSRFQAQSQWPLQRRAKTGKKLVRREQPLVIRIILAFFPFLRGWGGLF